MKIYGIEIPSSIHEIKIDDLSNAVKSKNSETLLKNLTEKMVGAYLSLLSEEEIIEIGIQFIKEEEKKKTFDEVLSEPAGYLPLEDEQLKRIEYLQIVPLMATRGLEHLLYTKLEPKSNLTTLVNKEEVLRYMTTYIEKHTDEIKETIRKNYEEDKNGIDIFVDIMFDIYKKAVENTIERAIKSTEYFKILPQTPKYLNSTQ